MRDKQQVRENIERQKKLLTELDGLGTARLLKECYYGCLHGDLKNYKSGYRFGNFKFSVYPHDTGIDYKISVVAPDESELVIDHRNYSYGHSDTIHERRYGVWDTHLDNTLGQLRDMQKQHILNRLDELEALLEIFLNEEKVLKDKFEAVFK